jgi:hypothetical protein
MYTAFAGFPKEWRSGVPRFLISGWQHGTCHDFADIAHW